MSTRLTILDEIKENYVKTFIAVYTLQLINRLLRIFALNRIKALAEYPSLYSCIRFQFADLIPNIYNLCSLCFLLL
jgi:hypothetical protein